MSLVIKLRSQLFCSHLVDTLKLTTTLIHFVVLDIPYVAQFLRTNLIFVTQALTVISHLIIPVVCFWIHALLQLIEFLVNCRSVFYVKQVSLAWRSYSVEHPLFGGRSERFPEASWIVWGWSIECSEWWSVIAIDEFHFNLLLFKELFSYLLFLRLLQSFFLCNLISLIFVPLPDVQYLIFEHCLNNLIGLPCLEDMHGLSYLVTVFLDQVCFQHFELLALVIFYFAKNVVDVFIAPLRCRWYERVWHLAVSSSHLMLLFHVLTSVIVSPRRLRPVQVYLDTGLRSIMDIRYIVDALVAGEVKANVTRLFLTRHS